MRSNLFFAAVVLGAAAGQMSFSARAQDLICCTGLVRFGGNWIGASRQCAQQLEQATAEQQADVCRQLGRNVCADVAPYCPICTGDEARQRNPGGNSLGPGDPIYDGMVDGARAAGIVGFGPEHIGIQDDREDDGILRWQIRIDAEGCILPNGDCILDAGERGYLPEGSQEGGRQMLLGAIRVVGDVVRVNGRYVNVETGVIEGAAVSETVRGTDRAAIARAMEDLFRKLAPPCRIARGLNLAG